MKSNSYPRFGEIAQTLVDNGYLPIPVVYGGKNPIPKEWPGYRFKPEDIDRYSQCAVGALSGQGDYPITILDLDSKDSQIRAELENLLAPYITLAREWDYPKVQWIFRAEKAGLPRKLSKKYDDGSTKGLPENVRNRTKDNFHQLEIRGVNNQSVFFGYNKLNGKCCRWLNERSPLNTPAWNLNILPEDVSERAIEILEKVCEGKNYQVVEKRRQEGPKAGQPFDDFTYAVEKANRPKVSLEKAREYLKLLPQSDCDNREDWLRVGMGLHFQFDGCDEAYRLFDEWSRGSEKYESEDDTQRVWDSFGRNLSSAPVTFKTVLEKANLEKEKKLREQEKEALAECLKKIEKAEDAFTVQDVLKKSDLQSTLSIEPLITHARKKLREFSGTTYSVTFLRGLLPKISEDEKVYPMSEDGCAERFIDMYGERLHYDEDKQEWLEFDGYHRRITLAAAMELARMSVAKGLEDAEKIKSDDLKKSVKGYLTASQKASTYKNILTIASGDPRIRIKNEELDSKVRFIAVKNGEIDLETLEFIKPNPKHFISQCMGTSYNRRADCPTFKRVVSEAFHGNEELVSGFQRAVSYALLGKPKEQKYFTLLGGGSNGKSTLINALLYVFGDYGDITPAETVMGEARSQGGQTREDLVRLAGKRLVVTMEPESSLPIKSGTIKAMTGGEKIAAREMYRKTQTFQPKLVLFICANQELILRDCDYGLTRRECIFPFDRRFSEEEQDKELPAKLKAEAEGILNWLIQGIRDYYSQGLNPPQLVKEETQRHIDSQDVLAEWLEDYCEIGKDFTATNLSLFQSWKNYSEKRGLDGIIRSTRSLGKQLSAKGFKSIRNCYNLRGRGYLGLRLKEASISESDSE